MSVRRLRRRPECLSAAQRQIHGCQRRAEPFLGGRPGLGAFKDMWAGKKPEKMLLDPVFVISQAT